MKEYDVVSDQDVEHARTAESHPEGNQDTSDENFFVGKWIKFKSWIDGKNPQETDEHINLLETGVGSSSTKAESPTTSDKPKVDTTTESKDKSEKETETPEENFVNKLLKVPASILSSGRNSDNELKFIDTHFSIEDSEVPDKLKSTDNKGTTTNPATNAEIVTETAKSGFWGQLLPGKDKSGRTEKDDTKESNADKEQGLTYVKGDDEKPTTSSCPKAPSIYEVKVHPNKSDKNNEQSERGGKDLIVENPVNASSDADGKGEHEDEASSEGTWDSIKHIFTPSEKKRSKSKHKEIDPEETNINETKADVHDTQNTLDLNEPKDETKQDKTHDQHKKNKKKEKYSNDEESAKPENVPKNQDEKEKQEQADEIKDTKDVDKPTEPTDR